MTESAVSIIIPTRNRSAILARCLAALPAGAQGVKPPEIIVVDDCSSDATPQVVEEFARASGWSVQYLRQERPHGANTARNRGVDVARGDVIVLIDDDVIVTEGWLAKLLDGLSMESPVTTGSVRLTIEGSILGKHRGEVGSFFAEILTAPRSFDGKVVPVACNMAAFRWVFQIASFDEIVRPPVEEGDWLRRTGVEARFMSEALVWHYKTPQEIQLKRVLQLAWIRGSEGGWWIRERAKAPSHELLPMAARSLGTSVRAFGHAISQCCWGGAVVAVSELSKALALAGLINRRARIPQSWR